MSIQSENRKAGPYLGDGANTTFPFGFKIFKAEDLLVVIANPDGIESTLVLGADYSARLNPDQEVAPGGVITTTSAVVAGYVVVMTSVVPVLQEVTFTNSGGFYPTLINQTLDKLTIISQQLAQAVSRAVKVTLSSEKTPDEILQSVFDSAKEADAAEALAKASAAQAASAESAAKASAAQAIATVSNYNQGGMTRALSIVQYTDIRAISDSSKDGVWVISTPVSLNSLALLRFEIRGYDYREGKVIDLVVVTHMGNGQSAPDGSSGDYVANSVLALGNSTKKSVWLGADSATNNLCLVFGTPQAPNYCVSFYVDVYFFYDLSVSTNPADWGVRCDGSIEPTESTGFGLVKLKKLA